MDGRGRSAFTLTKCTTKKRTYTQYFVHLFRPWSNSLFTTWWVSYRLWPSASSATFSPCRLTATLLSMGGTLPATCCWATGLFQLNIMKTLDGSREERNSVWRAKWMTPVSEVSWKMAAGTGGKLCTHRLLHFHRTLRLVSSFFISVCSLASQFSFQWELIITSSAVVSGISCHCAWMNFSFQLVPLCVTFTGWIICGRNLHFSTGCGVLLLHSCKFCVEHMSRKRNLPISVSISCFQLTQTRESSTPRLLCLCRLLFQILYFVADVSIHNHRSEHKVFHVTETPALCWTLAFIWPLVLIPILELIKRREIK